jgi:hypothetical protein
MAVQESGAGGITALRRLQAQTLSKGSSTFAPGAPLGYKKLQSYPFGMRNLLLTASMVAFATTAKAQTSITNNISRTWQVPTSCLSTTKLASGSWRDSKCDRVEVSTHGRSHNIRFVLDMLEVTYITDRASPQIVHGIGLTDPNGTLILNANGECKVTKEKAFLCSADVDEGKLVLMHIAAFPNGSFPELQAILR